MSNGYMWGSLVLAGAFAAFVYDQDALGAALIVIALVLASLERFS